MDLLETPRLRLRPLVHADLDDLARLHADPEVMAHFPTVLDRAGSDAVAEAVWVHHTRHGFAPSAVEVRAGGRFVGLVGLHRVDFEAGFTPAVELMWRLDRQTWGLGYATEAATATATYAFGKLGIDALVAFTVPGNVRSRRVMERLGMRHDPREDFDHPKLPAGHPLRRHVLYRLAPGPT